MAPLGNDTKSTVTLRLDGLMTVSSFAEVTSQFAKMLHELAKERDATSRIEWIISGLEYGSAILTAAAQPASAADADLAAALTSDYIDVARQVREHPSRRDRPVLRLVHSISTAASSGHEVIFETAQGDVVFTESAQGRPEPARTNVVIGTIRGRVQTLQQRKGLRFVLYDLVHDKAVTCYIAEGQENLMRDAWGRLAEVTGEVSRDEMTDRPRTVRHVTDVQVIDDDGDRFGFRRARGVLQRPPGSPPAEVLIRRVRDAI